MSNPILEIAGTTLRVKEYQKRLFHFDIDEVHGRPGGTASRNYRNNKDRFVEGKHFYRVSSDEIRRTKLFDIPDKSTADYMLITEKGYLLLVKSLNDDLAWEVQEQLIDGYFRARKLSSDLSPQMQMLYGMLDQMAKTEREAKKAKELAEKAFETTESIKAAVQQIFDDWRIEINEKINRIQRASNISYKELRNEMYTALERRSGCCLDTRLKNKRQRMLDNGYSNTAVNKANKMDIIGSDNKLREIFSKIVMEYDIRYCS